MNVNLAPLDGAIVTTAPLAPGSRPVALTRIGYRVRMTAYIRVQDIVDRAVMWIRVDGEFPQTGPLAFDNMQRRPITGTTDWDAYDIVLDIPLEAVNIAYGVLIAGPGKVWFDELHFEIVDNSVLLTDIR